MRSHEGRVRASVAAVLVAGSVTVAAGSAGATHPSSSCLDAFSETTTLQTGETRVVSALLRGTTPNCDEGNGIRPFTIQGSPVAIDFELTGPNDPDAGDSPGTPDLTCSIQPGASTCNVSYTGNATGTDSLRAWVDHDGASPPTGVTEADVTEQPGDADSDLTDVVTTTWVTDLAHAIDCDDQGPPDREREMRPDGADGPSVYCTIYDANGNPVPRVKRIYMEVVNGVNDPDPVDGASFNEPDFFCDTGTGANGQSPGFCGLSFPQYEGETGTSQICFWYGTPAQGASLCAAEPLHEGAAVDGSDGPNDFADAVEVTFEVRSSVSGGLDVEPEMEWGVFGEQRTLTGYVYDQFGSAFSGSTVVHFELFSGSPSDTDGNTPGSPDLTCTTQSSSSCTVSYTQTQTAGRDRICGWTNAAPAMSGTNVNGTCDGEGPVEADDSKGVADPPDPASDDVDVVEKEWETQTAPTRLDCSPENTVRPIGATLTVTCTVRDALGNGVPNVPVDFEATVFGDPDAGNTPASPDFTCTTDSGGSCSITHTPPTTASRAQGDETTYRAWIDQDDGPAVEADLAEGRDEPQFPGDRQETDITDVVENTMRFPMTLDAEVETRSGTVGNTETIAVTVYDNAQNPFVGPVLVNFEFFSGSPSRPTDGNTPATPDVTCTTSIQGTCSISWKSKTTGTDLVCVWIFATPAMSGNYPNGTCGPAGENLSNDFDDAPGVFDPPDSLFDRVDVVARTRS